MLKIDRSDLVDKAIHLGYQQCGSKGVDRNLTANIIDQLLFPEDRPANFERFHEKLCSPARAETLVIGRVFDSFFGKIQSLEVYAKHLQQALADKDAHISNVEAHTKHLQQALADKDAHISNVEAHTKHLQQA